MFVVCIISVHLQVLSSLSYINLLHNNSVSTGTRIITVQINDTSAASSQLVTVSLYVSNRNDEPALKIDATIQFTEGATSIDIVTLHLVDIIDEEMNNISSINVTLTATNGKLDEGDVIFIRTPYHPLIDLAEVTNRSVFLSTEGSVEQYEGVLRSILYVSLEDEPTYYINTTSKEKLNREIIVQITDNNPTHPSVAEHRIAINMTLINDNVPVINITNSSCLTSYPGINFVDKRSVNFRANHFKQRRLKLKRKSNIPLGLVS